MLRIERTLKLHLIALLGLVLVVQCSRSQKKFDAAEVSESGDNSTIPNLDQENLASGDGDFVPDPDGSEDLSGSSESAAETEDLEEIAAEVGLSTATLRAGALRVGAWDGSADDKPATAKWNFVDPVTGGTANTPPTTNTNNASTNNANATNTNGQGSANGAGANESGQLTREANGNVVFRIKSGTGQGPWNDANSAIVVPQGRILLVVNEDSIPHQLHTNGAPCQHGTEIPPGGSYQCNAQQTYNSGPLYDHISRGAVHIRTE